VKGVPPRQRLVAGGIEIPLDGFGGALLLPPHNRV